ncbi:MAG: PAAR domain-containing protein [Rubrivivax sp.]|nr:PAAR domain-containing protein [Rubrivivax sp.]
MAGSGTVLIGGRPALRAGDSCACGASVAVGLPTVQIG